MRYLLDTTWVVEYLRGNQKVVSRAQDLQVEGLAVSIVSLAELYEGVFRSNRPEANEQALRAFLGGVTILEVTEEAARIYGERRAELRGKGITIGALDLLIAATAIAHELPVLTFDGDFQRIPGLTAQE